MRSWINSVNWASPGYRPQLLRNWAKSCRASASQSTTTCRANAVAEAIRAGGGSAEVALGDLTTDAGADAVAVVALAFGPIDILVNNAGGFDHAGSWTEATATDWAEIYNSNVLSGV